jgi:hypothetical protein
MYEGEGFIGYETRSHSYDEGALPQEPKPVCMHRLVVVVVAIAVCNWSRSIEQLRARLVPGWVTIQVRIHHRANQACHP